MGKGQIEVMEQQVIGTDGVARRLQEEHDDPMERVPYASSGRRIHSFC